MSKTIQEAISNLGRILVGNEEHRVKVIRAIAGSPVGGGSTGLEVFLRTDSGGLPDALSKAVAYPATEGGALPAVDEVCWLLEASNGRFILLSQPSGWLPNWEMQDSVFSGTDFDSFATPLTGSSNTDGSWLIYTNSGSADGKYRLQTIQRTAKPATGQVAEMENITYANAAETLSRRTNEADKSGSSFATYKQETYASTSPVTPSARTTIQSSAERDDGTFGVASYFLQASVGHILAKAEGKFEVKAQGTGTPTGMIFSCTDPDVFFRVGGASNPIMTAQADASAVRSWGVFGSLAIKQPAPATLADVIAILQAFGLCL